MMLKLVREGLGRILVLVDYLTSPRPMQRGKAEQIAAEEAAQALALYHYHACPFCIRTRRAIRRLNILIELRDAQNDPDHRAVLLSEGGKIQVPCLRIVEPGGTRWLYESRDSVGFLNARVGAPATRAGSAVRETS